MLSIFLATNAVALPSSSALLKVLQSGALLSRPPRGVVSLSGPDARRLLHQQSSNAIEGTAANTVLDTAVLNGQGRIRDLVTAAVLPDELLLHMGLGPARRGGGSANLEKSPGERLLFLKKCTLWTLSIGNLTESRKRNIGCARRELPG